MIFTKLKKKINNFLSRGLLFVKGLSKIISSPGQSLSEKMIFVLGQASDEGRQTPFSAHNLIFSGDQAMFKPIVPHFSNKNQLFRFANKIHDLVGYGHGFVSVKNKQPLNRQKSCQTRINWVKAPDTSIYKIQCRANPESRQFIIGNKIVDILVDKLNDHTERLTIEPVRSFCF
jgi:hypothetical protein